MKVHAQQLGLWHGPHTEQNNRETAPTIICSLKISALSSPKAPSNARLCLCKQLAESDHSLPRQPPEGECRARAVLFWSGLLVH